MKSIILGTAGHIDHGKTALVRALTGVDTDRLKEEKKRGITIELGFANLVLGDAYLGIVDVPGHERFIKSMVAGAGGIDLVMLVIAADEGVMPQTKEHLDICSLLGVKRGFVALTKSDLVDPDWLTLVQDDIRQTLKDSFLAEADIIPCSATTEEGLNFVKAKLAELALACKPKEKKGLLRLPLDRVFSLKGFGTVVTGSLISGTLKVGDSVEVLPTSIKASVRSIQVHGEDRQHAYAGERTAVNLGGVDRQEVARGEVLAHLDSFEPSFMVEVELDLLQTANKALKERSRVLFHIGTRQQECVAVLLTTKVLKQGERALAQLRFEEPIVALPDDRFILRGFVKQENYGTTIGGGRIIKVGSNRIRPKEFEKIEKLEAIIQAKDEKERLALEIMLVGEVGISRAGLVGRLAYTPSQLDSLLNELLSKKEIIRFDKHEQRYIHKDIFKGLKERAVEIVDAFHNRLPLEKGVARQELHSRLGQYLDAKLFFLLIQELCKEDALVAEDELVWRKNYQVKTGADLDSIVQSVLKLVKKRVLAAPKRAEIEQELTLKKSQIDPAIKLLIDREELILVGDLIFSKEAIESFKTRLASYLEEHEKISAQDYKSLTGLSRKYVIPLAEYLDAQKFTIRIGDFRRLR